MEQNELLKTWSEKLFDELYESEVPKTDVGLKQAIAKCLEDVFNVGVETGKDTVKLEHQLGSLGKPYGFDH